MAEGTIFYHYKNKEGLFLAILEGLKDRDYQRALTDTSRKKNSPRAWIWWRGPSRYYLYLAGMKEDRFHLLHHRYPYDLAAVNPVCRELLETIYNCVVDIFEQAILLGQQDGSIGEVSSRKMALILFSLVDGLVRFKTYNLYDPGGLYNELISACRRMLGEYPSPRRGIRSSSGSEVGRSRPTDKLQ